MSGVSVEIVEVEMEKPREDSIIWNEELKQLGDKIAEHCDEAFRSHESDQAKDTALETTSLPLKAESPPMNRTSPDTSPSTNQPARPWDARPLPPIPAEDKGETTNQPKTVGHFFSQLSKPKPVPVSDRRAVSAPVYTQHGREVKPLPSIYENGVDGSDMGKARIVSAPADTSAALPVPNDNRGLDYLAKAENTIRVVTPSANAKTAASTKAPEDLSMRKSQSPVMPLGKRSKLDLRHQFAISGQRQISSSGDEGTSSPEGEGSEGAMKKKKTSWFRRLSKESTNEARGSADKVQDSSTVSSPRPESPFSFNQSKKKTFSLSFWKTGKMEPRMSLAEVDLFNDAQSPEPEAHIRTPPAQDMANATQRAGRGNANDMDGPNGRKIEVSQNWLARLFRVRPATRYLCFNMSRRRARQEVAIQLREWRKYGIKEVEVDKERNIVFAGIGSENCKRVSPISPTPPLVISMGL
jgi:hypothetical protein